MCKPFEKGTCHRADTCPNRHDLLDVKSVEDLLLNIWRNENSGMTAYLKITYLYSGPTNQKWKIQHCTSENRCLMDIESNDLAIAMPALMADLGARRANSVCYLLPLD